MSWIKIDKTYLKLAKAKYLELLLILLFLLVFIRKISTNEVIYELPQSKSQKINNIQNWQSLNKLKINTEQALVNFTEIESDAILDKVKMDPINGVVELRFNKFWYVYINPNTGLAIRIEKRPSLIIY